jgi:hypothetical protein
MSFGATAASTIMTAAKMRVERMEFRTIAGGTEHSAMCTTLTDRLPAYAFAKGDE